MDYDLEANFDKAMRGVYEDARRECNYRATRFLKMVAEQGGLKTAKTLLHSNTYSEGFTALWECGRLDVSMEALVLREPWSSLFTLEELDVAKQRLLALGYEGPELRYA